VSYQTLKRQIEMMHITGVGLVNVTLWLAGALLDADISRGEFKILIKLLSEKLDA
jgi:hypothetical protein